MNWLSLVTGGAGSIAVLVAWLGAILSGYMHTGGEFDREAEAHRLERLAHEETRKALAAANDRADAAVKASELVAEAFTKARHRSVRGN